MSLRIRSAAITYSVETMEVKEVLHMSKGKGEQSYAQTSTCALQKLTATTRPFIASAVNSLFREDLFPCWLLNVADLGCASGPNTFSFISTVIDDVKRNCQESKCDIPEIQFYLNDLPGNDFNTLFSTLPEFSKNSEGLSCLVVGAPGSFHGRLVPRNSLHLAHSSFSAHWLSRTPHLTSGEGVPLNKGKIYISKTSPAAVKEAYLAQFPEDLTTFLRHRSEEMVTGGRLVLVNHGRRTPDFASMESYYVWELLAEAISSMISEGLVEEEKLDTLNVPYYTATREETVEIVEKEGSFTVEHAETIALDLYGEGEDPWLRGKKIAKHVQSYTGAIVSHHFGHHIMDKLYNEKLAYLIGLNLITESTHKMIAIVLVLRKSISKS